MRRLNKAAYTEIVASNKSPFMAYVFSDIQEVINSLTEDLIVEDDHDAKTIIQGKIRGLQELVNDYKRK